MRRLSELRSVLQKKANTVRVFSKIETLFICSILQNPHQMSRRLLLLFSLFLSFILKTSCQNLDINILREINLNRNRSLDGTFVTITNSLKLVTAAVTIGMAGVALIKRDTNMFRSVLVMAASSIVQGLITNNLKRIVARPRSFVMFTQLDNFDDLRDKSKTFVPLQSK